MRIFISYGHDFTEEATMLAESLKSAGHDIWIDRENIISGSDWRNSITEAILSADLILVLLSKYGLRDDGVCLDELAIAVSCNRRNIRPVIMEKDLKIWFRLIYPGSSFLTCRTGVIFLRINLTNGIRKIQAARKYQSQKSDGL